jgi:predicted KAP-like P-loop ATPase
MKGLFNDNESNIDYIGYTNYISVFKYIIDNDEDLIEPPIVFGLHGDWGIGKSTFMNLLNKELEENKKNITIRINPWEYKDSNDIVSLFFVELYKKLKEKSLIEHLKDGFDKLFELIYPLKLKVNTPIVDFEYDIAKIKDIEKVKILDGYINENHLKKENIQKLFNKTFLSEYKIIVFIDDLDRCSVDKVINILESVKLFLNTNRCIFFLGCDVNYLNSAVANYYEKFIKVNDEILKNSKIQYNIMDDMDSINRFTKEYLEKIIQVPFHIPSIDKNAMELYIESILNGRIEKTNEMSEFSKLLKKKGSQFKKEIPKKLVKELFAKRIINPRRIKRVLNIIYLNYLFLMMKIIISMKVNYLQKKYV